MAGSRKAGLPYPSTLPLRTCSIGHSPSERSRPCNFAFQRQDCLLLSFSRSFSWRRVIDSQWLTRNPSDSAPRKTGRDVKETSMQIFTRTRGCNRMIELVENFNHYVFHPNGNHAFMIIRAISDSSAHFEGTRFPCCSLVPAVSRTD